MNQLTPFHFALKAVELFDMNEIKKSETPLWIEYQLATMQEQAYNLIVSYAS